jgi:hypothetical protein
LNEEKEMIKLDDHKWRTFKGGYRIPYDASTALQRIEEGTSIEAAWDELWNELHHQGDVGEASYAAVPHIVRIQKSKSDADWNAYALISTIEVERHRKGNPPLPDWLAEEYHVAWAEVIDVAMRDLKKTNNSIAIHSILGALALAKQQIKLGAFIGFSDESEIDEFLEDHNAWTELYTDQTDAK